MKHCKLLLCTCLLNNFSHLKLSGWKNLDKSILFFKWEGILGYHKEETLKGRESEWQAEGKINCKDVSDCYLNISFSNAFVNPEFINQPSIPKYQLFLSVLMTNRKSHIPAHPLSDSSYSFNIFRWVLFHLRGLPGVGLCPPKVAGRTAVLWSILSLSSPLWDQVPNPSEMKEAVVRMFVK